MKGNFWGVAWACLVMLPMSVLGDGGFIPSTALERIQIPNQRALIHYASGRETLVIDTAFRGGGTNFAWIIPVPGEPKLEPVSAGVFTTLDTIFQPKIIHERFPLYKLAIILGLVLAFILWMARRGELAAALAVVFLSLILCGLFLPALSTGGVGVRSVSKQLTISEQARVGIYDTATLSSRDGDAVLKWLNQNGFFTPTNFIPAIRSYAEEGWFFVASKIHPGTDLSEPGLVHPLSLSFKTTRAVYPLRLTGINNSKCDIELFVFGPHRAESGRFKVERCAEASYPPSEQSRGRRLENLRIRHPSLRALVQDSPTATKLVANLSGEQMDRDAYLDWVPFNEKRLTRYSVHGAAISSANVSVPVLTTALLLLFSSFWFAEQSSRGARQLRKISGALGLIGLTCGAALFICLPKIQVVVSRVPSLRMEHLHYTIPAALMQYSLQHGFWKNGRPGPTIEWVRQQLALDSEFRRMLDGGNQTNLFSGEPWREEDSPGNYTLRNTPEGIQYSWYDIEGGENVVPLFEQVDNSN